MSPLFSDEKFKDNFGHIQNRLPNTLSASFPNIDITGRDILEATSGQVEASTTAACHTNTGGSPVLIKSGVESKDALKTIRFSFGRLTSKKDVEEMTQIIAQIVLSRSIKNK